VFVVVERGLAELLIFCLLIWHGYLSFCRLSGA
jgi:hypothetical protein